VNEQVFDRTRKIVVSVKRFGVSATVSFPSDELTTTHNQKIKIFQIRGRGTPDIEGDGEAAFELFKAIKIDGDEFSQDAAQIAIGFLLRTEVEEPERTADGYKVPVIVCGGIRTVHSLRAPSVKDEANYDRKCLWMGERKFNRIPVRYSLPNVAELYESLFISAEGYPGAGAEQLAGIPFVHRHAALRGLFDAVKESDSDGDPDISFK
jgi:hypothetical protein